MRSSLSLSATCIGMTTGPNGVRSLSLPYGEIVRYLEAVPDPYPGNDGVSYSLWLMKSLPVAYVFHAMF